MTNNTNNNHYQNNEIDFRKIYKVIINSKILIILITLSFSSLAFIYSSQKTSVFKSTAILEVGTYHDIYSKDGTYNDININEKNIETVKDLIRNVRVDLIFKQQLTEVNKLEFGSIEDQLLEINYSAPIDEFNENLIKETVIYIETKHSDILNRINNLNKQQILSEIENINNSLNYLNNSNKQQILSEIENINNSLNYLNNSNKQQILSEIENINSEIENVNNSLNYLKNSNKQRILSEIENVNNKLPVLKNKIRLLEIVILQDKENIELLKSAPLLQLERASRSPTLEQIVFSYKNDLNDFNLNLIDLLRQKALLELQLKTLEENTWQSKESFILTQKLAKLENRRKIMEDSDSFSSKEYFALTQKLTTLENRRKIMEDSDSFSSKEYFALTQKLTTLEIKYKTLENKLQNKTRLMDAISTEEVHSNTYVITMLGTIIGFIFSIFIAIFRQSLLLEDR